MFVSWEKTNISKNSPIEVCTKLTPFEDNCIPIEDSIICSTFVNHVFIIQNRQTPRYLWWVSLLIWICLKNRICSISESTTQLGNNIKTVIFKVFQHLVHIIIFITHFPISLVNISERIPSHKLNHVMSMSCVKPFTPMTSNRGRIKREAILFV